MALGRADPVPLRCGSGRSPPARAEYDAIMRALEPGWGSDDDTAHAAEVFGMALAVAYVWACNGRLAGQLQPLRMLESLAVWEEAARLRPAEGDRETDRRARLAGKFRGLAGNAIGDVSDAAKAILGVQYSGVQVVAPADEVAYWPGQNPGPPGRQWSSNRAHIAVRMNRDGLIGEDFLSLRLAVEQMMDAMLPAWMTFDVVVGSSFVVNSGKLSQEAL